MADEPDREALHAEQGQAQDNSPGSLLRRAREHRQMSVEELSGETALPRATIEALENNDFDRLAQPVFVRGYYRKCARVLEVDQETIMAAYADHTGVAGPRPADPGRVDVITQDVTPGNWRPLWVVVAVVVIIVIGVFAWAKLPTFAGEDAGISAPVVLEHAPEPDHGKSEPAPPVSATPQATADINTTPAQTTPPPPPAMPPPRQQETVADGAAPVISPTPVAAPELPRLVLRFAQRSWVEVTDASGARLLVGTIDGGNQRVLEGQPPYHVTLGYAPGVTISLGDQVVYAGRHYEADNTARFRVSADGSLQ
ncbi:MAG: DUF4115 domain-containing protein [Salinisphaera sp.]|nr:DUF4115 domain-containing protein [Salinisphaera sp.]MDN5937165.1 DUF4115 domain-containing protein [Salinisphaera sp.]